MTTDRTQREGRGRRSTDNGECSEFCQAHSGTVTYVKGLYAMLAILISLVGTQMLFQIPNIKIDILNEVKGVTARIVELEKKDIEVSGKLTDMETRIENLEKRGHK